MDRRAFLTSTLALGAGAAVGLPVIASSEAGKRPATEAEIARALDAFNYKSEVEAAGLELCPPLPQGSDLYGDGLEGVAHRQDMFWACLVSSRRPIPAYEQFGPVLRRAWFDLWRQSGKPAALLARELGEPFTFITDPTIVHSGSEFWVFIHISKGFVWPHPGYGQTPNDLLACARWLASRLARVSVFDQARILERLREQNAVLHALTVHEGKRLLRGEWIEVTV